MKNGAHDQRTLADLTSEFAAVRASTLAMFQVSRRRPRLVATHRDDRAAVAYIIAGHERHHVDILRQRYL